jgi:hypothetical protein
VYSYKRVLALTERAFADALATIEAAAKTDTPAQSCHALTQQHDLIREPEVYADLFTHAAMAASACGEVAMVPETTTSQGGQA